MRENENWAEVVRRGEGSRDMRGGFEMSVVSREKKKI